MNLHIILIIKGAAVVDRIDAYRNNKIIQKEYIRVKYNSMII